MGKYGGVNLHVWNGEALRVRIGYILRPHQKGTTLLDFQGILVQFLRSGQGKDLKS